MKIIVIKAENKTFNDKKKTQIVAKCGFKKAGGINTNGFGNYTEEEKTWNGFVRFNLWNNASLSEDQLPAEGQELSIPVKNLYSFAKKDWVGDDGKERFSIELTLSSDPKGWDSKLASYMTDFNPDWERS